MSIPVELGDLEGALGGVGSGYLVSTPLTGPKAGCPKVVAVAPAAGDGAIRVPGPGRGTLLNVADNPLVVLVFWPAEEHGLSLLVDGTAVAGGPEGADVLLTPTSAVWHRPRAHAEAAQDGA